MIENEPRKRRIWNPIKRFRAWRAARKASPQLLAVAMTDATMYAELDRLYRKWKSYPAGSRLREQYRIRYRVAVGQRMDALRTAMNAYGLMDRPGSVQAADAVIGSRLAEMEATRPNRRGRG